MSPDGKPTSNVEIVHALGRRLHLLSPSLRDHRAACERVAERLAGEGTFDRVSVRPLTGSIVLERDQGDLDAHAAVQKLREVLEAERNDQGEPLLSAPRVHDGPTRLARALVTATRELNEDIATALDRHADLATLGPFALFLAGALHVSVTGQVPAPPWSSLFWYSLRSFLSFNQDAVKSQPEPSPPGS